MNRGKEGKPHETKPSLKNGHGDGPATNSIKLPSFNQPNKISNLGESLGKNVSSLLGKWEIL